MPIYEYVCAQCGKTNDVLQKVTDPAPSICMSCSSEGTLSRRVSRTSFVLKGGGWYSDLYSSTKKDGSTKDGSTKKDGGNTDSSSAAPEPKPAAASGDKS